MIMILFAACAGIGTFAWFEFLSPEMRQSIRSLNAAPEQDKDGDVDVPTPAPPAAAEPPQVAEAPAPPSPPAPDPVETPQSPVATPEPAAPAVTVPDPAPATSRSEEPTAVDSTANNELKGLIQDATAGSATTQNELGVRYLVGQGIAQDYSQAALWLRRAAAKDVTNAQYNLGVLFDSGRGVDPDPVEPLIWFHSAAGRGIERNSEEALKWLRRAAESKIAEAQFSLANILATSPKTHESLIDAYYWYKIADSQGIAEAAERGEQVAARLTAEERAGVNRRVSHYLGQSIPRPLKRSSDGQTEPSKATSPAPTPPAVPAATAITPAAPAPTTPAETSPAASSSENSTRPVSPKIVSQI